MKRIFIILFLLSPLFLNAQKIGEMAPEKPPGEFPPYAWGIDLLFSDGGFGVGTFLRRSFSTKVTGFVDVSFSESKNEREFEYYDYWGRPIVVGKENRVFIVPLTFGFQYRLFEKNLTDNLRPYLSGGIGPSFAVSTPYEVEFFNSFKYAKFHLGVGGYLGLGADFGLSKKNLLGLSLRYQYTKFISEGVEHMKGQIVTEINAFYVSIKMGLMF